MNSRFGYLYHVYQYLSSVIMQVESIVAATAIVGQINVTESYALVCSFIYAYE